MKRQSSSSLQQPFMKATTISKSKVRSGVDGSTKSSQHQHQHQNQNQVDSTPPTTPTAMSTTAHQLIDEIRNIYLAIKGLPNLAPGPQTNTLLTRLVELCTQPYSSDFANHVLSIPGVNDLCLALRPLCATAEGELERYWAQRITSTTASPLAPPTHTLTLLTSFPYHDNYLDLSRLECSALEAFLPTCSPDCRPSPCKLAFIGSGPMPLTSFCILDRYPEAIVHNVDRDADALRVSQELSKRCGYGERMTFSCEDVSGRGALTGTEWKGFQVVFLAALVGMDTESKLGILKGLAEKLEPGCLVVVRSAQGLRGVLYPVLDLSPELQRIGLDTLVVVHPWTKVVNSVIVLRVRER